MRKMRDTAYQGRSADRNDVCHAPGTKLSLTRTAIFLWRIRKYLTPESLHVFFQGFSQFGGKTHAFACVVSRDEPVTQCPDLIFEGTIQCIEDKAV